MTKRYEKFFQRNVHNLQEMLTLYEDGWSSVALGRKYGCDHTSILYQVKKHGITQRRVRVGITETKNVLYYPVPHKKEKGKYDHLIEESINPGKSYREYVEENKQRHPRSKIKDNLPQGVQVGKVRFPHNANAKL